MNFTLCTICVEKLKISWYTTRVFEVRTLVMVHDQPLSLSSFLSSLTSTPDLRVVPEPVHGQVIAPSRHAVEELRRAKRRRGRNDLSREERAAIWREFDAADAARVIEGVDFSRAQLAELIKARQTGRVEIRTMEPHLADYDTANGHMTMDKLLPEDMVGLKLAADLHRIFPKARQVSILDDYAHQSDTGERPYALRSVTAFKRGLIRLMKEAGALPEEVTIGKEYAFMRESDLAHEAVYKLVWRLELRRCIYMGEGQTVRFVTHDAENPLLDDAILRTKSGHWLRLACDAASYLKRENLSATHLIVLPNYMKRQQDQVWEILRVLGIEPHNYHNIYYDPALTPEHISRVILSAFENV